MTCASRPPSRSWTSSPTWAGRSTTLIRTSRKSPPTREHARWTGTRSVEWTPEKIASYDCILIATYHQAFDMEGLLQHADLIVDTRNAVAKAGLVPRDGQLVKA